MSTSMTRIRLRSRRQAGVDDQILDAAGLRDDQVVQLLHEGQIQAGGLGEPGRPLLHHTDPVRLHHRHAVLALVVSDAAAHGDACTQ